MKVFVVSKKMLIYALAALAVIAAIILLVLLLSGSDRDKTALGTNNGKDRGSSLHDRADSYELEVFAGMMKELPVYSVDRNDKKIALTIDAAWQDDKTPFILSTLEKYGIRATFFLCGFWVEDHPDMVKRIADAGH